MHTDALSSEDKIDTFAEADAHAPGVETRTTFVSFGPIGRLNGGGTTALTVKLRALTGPGGTREFFEVTHSPIMNFDLHALANAAERARRFVGDARCVDFSTMFHTDWEAVAREVAMPFQRRYFSNGEMALSTPMSDRNAVGIKRFVDTMAGMLIDSELRKHLANALDVLDVIAPRPWSHGQHNFDDWKHATCASAELWSPEDIERINALWSAHPSVATQPRADLALILRAIDTIHPRPWTLDQVRTWLTPGPRRLAAWWHDSPITAWSDSDFVAVANSLPRTEIGNVGVDVADHPDRTAVTLVEDRPDGRREIVGLYSVDRPSCATGDFDKIEGAAVAQMQTWLAATQAHLAREYVDLDALEAAYHMDASAFTQDQGPEGVG